MASNSDIINKASESVSRLFKEKLPTWAVYHNYDHTAETVAAVEEIGQESKLSKAQIEIVLLAAWFHDAGHTETSDGHEERSVEIATRFLGENGYPQDRLDQVVACILATKVSHTPRNVMEEVLCDADRLHVGKKKFLQKSTLMRIESERRVGKPLSDIEWLNSTVDFLMKHQFYTEYAQLEYAKQRTKNLIKLQERLREATAEHETFHADHQLRREKLASKVEKEKIPVRGIETMFRVTSGNHIDLSSIADHKANMMISTNSLIMTLVVGLFGRGFAESLEPKLIIPVLILVLVCMATIVFAILATRPKVTRGTFTKEDIQQKRTNLLFFGNFYNMRLEDFQWGISEMMKDADYLYGSMTKDIYYLGQVLGRKYKYLRICYNVFMYGLIVGVIAFAIAFIF